MTQATRDGATNSYVYDSNSNRTQMTGPQGTATAAYDNQDELISYGSKYFTYSANGEVKSILDSFNELTTTYSYDVFGRLISASVPVVGLSTAKIIGYLYDAKGRRIGKTLNGALTSQFLYQDQKVAQYQDVLTGAWETFIYSSKSNVPTAMRKVILGLPNQTTMGGLINQSVPVAVTTYRIVSDERGSVRLVIDGGSGSIIQEMDYDEFGNVIKDTNPGFQPFGFAGCLYDNDTKLCHFGARDYDASTGRWVTRDPLLFQGGDTNLYGYVLQDPINGIDPSELYGTQSCNYYTQACAANGGSYACYIAPTICGGVPNSAYTDCVRQCLQEEQQNNLPNQNQCSANNQPNGPDLFNQHVDCFKGCNANNQNPYNPSGPSLPNGNPSLY